MGGGGAKFPWRLPTSNTWAKFGCFMQVTGVANGWRMDHTLHTCIYLVAVYHRANSHIGFRINSQIIIAWEKHGLMYSFNMNGYRGVGAGGQGGRAPLPSTF